jgi:hypothetical protein
VSERDEQFQRLVATLREPVHIEPGFDRRVMRAIAAEPEPKVRLRTVVLDWLTRGRPVRLSPLSGFALATAVLAGVIVGRVWLAPLPGETGLTATPASVSRGPATTQFVIVAPGARTVSLVGDFNDWDVAATPMRAAPDDGVWSVSVPLTPGRYRYAFLVDGATWLADPSAPRAADSDFGSPNSVVTVGQP